jgi:hypothetical protein
MHRRRIRFRIKSAQSDLKLRQSSMLKVRILSIVIPPCPQEITEEQLRGVGPSFNARV